MNDTRTFDSHFNICPVCRHPIESVPRPLPFGLFACPHCRSRLVISWSGHYVRDPFTLRQIAIGRALRRQSHPLARFLRDFKADRQASLVVVAVSAALLGCSFLGLQKWHRPPFANFLERITHWLEPSETVP